MTPGTGTQGATSEPSRRCRNVAGLVLPCALLLAVFVSGCEGFAPEAPALVGILEDSQGNLVDVDEMIGDEELLAYVASDDEHIYVASGAEETVADTLNAEIQGETWTYRQEGQIQTRRRKELRSEDYFPRVLHVKWTILRGYKCTAVPADSWLEVHNKRGRFIRSFKTTQADWWCIRQAGFGCKLVLKTVTDGEFFTRRNGRGRRVVETRRLAACTP